MSQESEKCELCKKAAQLTTCKSCGKGYCPECQSPSTKQNFCKECVSMEGIISKS